MAVKWIGKWRVPPGGSEPPEPERYIVGVPCKDLDDDELRELAHQEGKRRDVYERELERSGLFVVVEKEQAPAVPAEEVTNGDGS